MSEQKGVYAHVGLPGLSALFNGMSEPSKSTEELIKEALEKATPGEWFRDHDGVCDMNNDPITAEVYCRDDLHLIINAPTWLKYLLSALDNERIKTEELKWKLSHPVVCQGICTSQLDDYCGMHMSNETCITCNAIWTQAHLENKERDIERLKAEHTAMKKELQWYANEKTYKLGVNITMGTAFPTHEPIKSDKGERARNVIKTLSKEATQ